MKTVSVATELKSAILDSPVVLGVGFKMYFDQAQTTRWCTAVAEIAQRHEAITSGVVTLFVLPSFTALAGAVGIFADTPVQVGAQDLFWEDRGAYTGEVSGTDLRDLGCALVEIGHAERRGIFGETDDVFGAKLAAAIRNGLLPVLCVGEARQGSASEAAASCIRQLEKILGRHDTVGPMVLAYEPEWAIGAERAASTQHVSEVAALLRAWLQKRPGCEKSRVIYGGSAGPGVFSELGDEVDGLFLGRFAHDPAALESILDEVVAAAAADTSEHLSLKDRRFSARGTGSDPQIQG